MCYGTLDGKPGNMDNLVEHWAASTSPNHPRHADAINQGATYPVPGAPTSAPAPNAPSAPAAPPAPPPPPPAPPPGTNGSKGRLKLKPSVSQSQKAATASGASVFRSNDLTIPTGGNLNRVGVGVNIPTI